MIEMDMLSDPTIVSDEFQPSYIPVEKPPRAPTYHSTPPAFPQTKTGSHSSLSMIADLERIIDSKLDMVKQLDHALVQNRSRGSLANSKSRGSTAHLKNSSTQFLQEQAHFPPDHVATLQ